MAEELGKIEKPLAEDFKYGRKLFFVPLIFPGKELPEEFQEKYNRYWIQVESQIANLEIKLGRTHRIFHELIPEGGEAGIEALKKLNTNSLQIVRNRMQNGAILEATEDEGTLTELMDWSRCLSLGLQSQKVFSTIYGFYTETNKKRFDFVSKKLNDTLKENETGILIMAESHHVQFQPDVKLFYIAPPALDEIKRWTRDYEAKLKDPQAEEPKSQEAKPQSPKE